MLLTKPHQFGKHLLMVKKLITLLFVAFLPLSSFDFDIASAAESNLIANPSVVQADSGGTKPADWNTGSWGTNTNSFNYIQESTNSYLSVQLSSYSTGDAKWYFNPVAVSPNVQYIFSDSYKSDVATSVIAQTSDSSGKLSYQEIGQLSASSNWQTASFTFTTTATAAQITIFHLINQVGYLHTDNFSLSLYQAPLPPPPPVTPTTILNPSLETASTANTKMPADWQTSKWGTNTTSFTYENSGHSGSKSVKIVISKYTSGDAKWVFTPVAVTPGNEYYFSDWYKSSIASEIVVKFTDAMGQESFKWLGTEAKSTAWKKTNHQFVAPAGAVTATVYHLIAAKGNLQTDDYLLGESQKLIITDNVPNNSFEQTNDGSLPLGWNRENWGTNKANFTYLSTGQTGNHSAKVQISSYTSGDAKWGYSPQPAIPGADYRFTDYYQSNVLTHVVVRLTAFDGSERYLGLVNAEPSTAWKKYTDIFTVPIDTKEITVLHFIAAVGYLITDDYSVTPVQIQGFNRALLSLTFDDGWEENYASVLPLLNQYGFKSTQYYATTFIQEQEYDIDKILAFANAGHEIGSHSITHPFMTSLPVNELEIELRDSKSYLENIVGLGKINNFATPYGDYNSQVIGELKKYYTSHRSTDEGFNSKDNFNTYNLRVQNMTNTTTLAQYQEWIRKAQEDNTWLILVYHRIGENPTQFETSPSDFAAQMQVVNQSGIAVKTIGEALNEILPQL